MEAPAPDMPAPHSRDRPDGIDGWDMTARYRELIKQNIEYECLTSQYNRERLDGVVELMLETVCSQRPYIRVAGDEYPREVVKSRLLKVTSSHIQYVFDVMDKNTSKVRNIKAYMLTALYNAPATIDHYYRAEVNHDLYGSF